MLSVNEQTVRMHAAMPKVHTRRESNALHVCEGLSK